VSLKTFGANDAITERTSAQYTCTFTGPTGAAISGAAIRAITASLYDHDSAVINSRDAQNVLGANGGALSGDTFTLTLGALDTVAVGTREMQLRTLVLRVTFDTGVLVHEVRFFVRNVSQLAN
jgi:hypothetical protein